MEKNLSLGILMAFLVTGNSVSVMAADNLDGTNSGGKLTVPGGIYDYIYGSKLEETNGEANNTVSGSVTINDENSSITINKAVAGSYASSINNNAFSQGGSVSINGGEYNFLKEENKKFVGIFGSYAEGIYNTNNVNGEVKATGGEVTLDNVSCESIKSVNSNNHGIVGSSVYVQFDSQKAKDFKINAFAEGGSANVTNSELQDHVIGSFITSSIKEGAKNVKINEGLFQASGGTINILDSTFTTAYGSGIIFNTVFDENKKAILKALNGTVNISNSKGMNSDIVGNYISSQKSFSFTENGKVNIEKSVLEKYISIAGSSSESTEYNAESKNGMVIMKNTNATIYGSQGYYLDNTGIIGSYSLAYENYGKASNGTVVIENSNIQGNVKGSAVRSSIIDKVDVDTGTVIIKDSIVEGDVYGTKAYGGADTKSNNGDVQIINSTIVYGTARGQFDSSGVKDIYWGKVIYGGYAYGYGDVESSNNKIIIKNGELEKCDIYGGYSGAANNYIDIVPIAKAENNQITIVGKDNKFKDVFAGYAEVLKDGNVNINKNSITLLDADKANYSKSNLYGYYWDVYNNKEQATITTDDNNLIIDNWTGKVGSANNFNNIKFQNLNWENQGTVLELIGDGNGNLKDSLEDTKIDLPGSITINNGAVLTVDDYMYFIKHEDGTDLGTDKTTGEGQNIFTSGVAVEGTGKVEVEDNGDVKYIITDVKNTDQIDSATDNRAVAAAFLVTGSDLVVDGLNSMEQDQLFGVKTFAIVEGVDKTHEVGNDLKVNGWNGLYGVGNIKETKDGQISYAAFFENGTANYRTYNTFMDEAFRGDGSIVYNGGGIAGRYKKDNGVYVEASVRAGLLKNQMQNIFRDGNGNSYGYKTESPYWALHAGIGQIFELENDRDLDVYARYYHTYNEGDSFSVAGDKFNVDDITSDRLRLGVRYNTNKDNKWRTYYGAAWEYEFNGEAKVRVNDKALEKESLKGASCFAEIGFNYQKDKNSPWDFEGRLRGYAGHTKGMSGMLRATYNF